MVKQLSSVEHQCWKNVRYSRRECVEVVSIPSLVESDQLQPTVCRILQNTGVNIYGNQIEACHRMDKNTDRIIVKFSSRKDCEHTMRVKKNWKILMLLTWTFQQGQSSILMTVCVLLIEDCGIKPRNYGTRIKFFFFLLLMVQLG